LPPARRPGDRKPSDGTLVIIPTYDEVENLPLILARVRKARPDVHVLVVDDGSPDGTGDLADELSAADRAHVHVMHRTAKDGLGAAYLAAFAWGLEQGYSVLVEMFSCPARYKVCNDVMPAALRMLRMPRIFPQTTCVSLASITSTSSL
jgi:cellulose synthase/poly-beta-1,6-N-acetylglucosamine synthase-like glycosyltransferase